MTYYLYWIHLPDHNNILKEGYIGVSKQPKRRFYRHKNSTENPHLQNAFIKYNDIIQTVLLKGNKDYCYEMEVKFRPSDQIGWNINKGGIAPPSPLGKKLSEETKERMRKPKPMGFSENRKGNKNPNWKKGAATGKKWYYNPITKYSTYFIPNTQPNNWIKGRYSRKKLNANFN